MIEETFFEGGYVLPDARPGMVWGFHLYPGGRKEIRQCPSDRTQALSDAMDSLRAGKMAVVRLDMAEILATWQAATQLQGEVLAR